VQPAKNAKAKKLSRRFCARFDIKKRCGIGPTWPITKHRWKLTRNDHEKTTAAGGADCNRLPLFRFSRHLDHGLVSRASDRPSEMDRLRVDDLFHRVHFEGFSLAHSHGADQT